MVDPCVTALSSIFHETPLHSFLYTRICVGVGVSFLHQMQLHHIHLRNTSPPPMSTESYAHLLLAMSHHSKSQFLHFSWISHLPSMQYVRFQHQPTCCHRFSAHEDVPLSCPSTATLYHPNLVEESYDASNHLDQDPYLPCVTVTTATTTDTAS